MRELVSSSRFLHAFTVTASVAALLAIATPAHAADPRSRVSDLEVTLSVGGMKFTDRSNLDETTIDMLATAEGPFGAKQNGKLRVASCSGNFNGKLKVGWEVVKDHDTSMLHWTLGNLGGASMPLDTRTSFSLAPAKTAGGDDSGSKTWDISMPIVKGQAMYHLEAWTSKEGQRSTAKTILFRLKCEEALGKRAIDPNIGPRPGTEPKDLTNKIGPRPESQGGGSVPQLEVRRVKVDVGLPDANAIEWFKGQPTTKEILFHEQTGPGFERGGAQWGSTKTVVVNGQSYQSRGIDSCSSALKLKGYAVGVKNNSTVVGYVGASANDLKVSTSGPSGTSNVSGKVGPVAKATESSATLAAASSGFVFFPSGAYAVKAELVPPAASTTPENNSAALNVVFKCKAVNAQTWN